MELRSQMEFGNEGGDFLARLVDPWDNLDPWNSMKPVFLELVFDAVDCAKAGLDSRDEIEDGLQEQLRASGLGAVSGGGGGLGKYNIDVDVFDEDKLEEALSLVRNALIQLNVPRTSKIIRHQPERQVLSVYQ